MSEAILYYCSEYKTLYYLINNQYYNAESLSPVILKDELELIQLLQVDLEGNIICEHISKITDNTISKVNKKKLLSQPVFIKTTTGWAILNSHSDEIGGGYLFF